LKPDLKPRKRGNLIFFSSNNMYII
jgi:hypothetical protein